MVFLITIDLRNGHFAAVVLTEKHPLPSPELCSAERAEETKGQRQGK